MKKKEREKSESAEREKKNRKNSRFFLPPTPDARSRAQSCSAGGKGRILSKMYIMLNIIIMSRSLVVMGDRGESICELDGKRQREETKGGS
jgi:hypothetical protein